MVEVATLTLGHGGACRFPEVPSSLPHTMPVMARALRQIEKVETVHGGRIAASARVAAGWSRTCRSTGLPPWPATTPSERDPFPVKDPELTFAKLGETVRTNLPGARLRHHLGFRHTIEWTRPA